jgi:hypothetical protein
MSVIESMFYLFCLARLKKASKARYDPRVVPSIVRNSGNTAKSPQSGRRRPEAGRRPESVRSSSVAPRPGRVLVSLRRLEELQTKAICRFIGRVLESRTSSSRSRSKKESFANLSFLVA